NPSLAQAYAVNIIAIYQNYRWRLYRAQREADAPWTGLENKDTWQDGHLKGAGAAELAFWLGERAPAAPTTRPASTKPAARKPAARPGAATARAKKDRKGSRTKK